MRTIDMVLLVVILNVPSDWNANLTRQIRIGLRMLSASATNECLEWHRRTGLDNNE